MRFIVAAFSLALCSVSSPVFAQEVVTPSTATPPPSVQKEAMVCRRIEQIGSRLARKRVCRTAAEWAQQSDQGRRDLEIQQQNRVQQ